MTATLILGKDVDGRGELVVRDDRARLRKNLTTLNLIVGDATEQGADVIAAFAKSRVLRNISRPVTTVFWVGRMPTISTSSLILTMPRSTRPVTTVPRPEMVMTSSIGIKNGLSLARTGSGM
jgi:hypothetical protein